MTEYRRNFLGVYPEDRAGDASKDGGISENGHNDARQADGFRKSSTHPTGLMPHGGFPALTRIVGKTAKAENSCCFCLAAAFFGSPRRPAGMLVAL